MHLSVREMIESDIENVVNYFLNAEISFLKGMGADPSKLPQKDTWIQNIKSELYKNYPEKNIYYVIWILDDKPIGHNSINKIKYKEEAFMHLHLWHNEFRQKGLGLKFLKLSIPIFFEKFRLKKLICEPYALNPAPNGTLPKFGFKLIKTYETIPGPINLPQLVTRYELNREELLKCSNEI